MGKYDSGNRRPRCFSLVKSFDYKEVHTEWVINDKIGPKLVKYIDCLAQSSLKGGGKGKVIVVAHSMGGLAARYATNQTIGGRSVAAETDVITIATPHLGSGFSDICLNLAKIGARPAECEGSAVKALAPGSKELNDLPKFPASVPVRAIAGDVFIRSDFGFGHIDYDLGGDLVVSVNSATAESTSTGHGDSIHVIKCFGDNAITTRSHASCEHGSMLNDPNIQRSVKEGIEQFVASINQIKSTASSKPKVPCLLVGSSRCSTS
jgi:hypothetical protein